MDFAGLIHGTFDACSSQSGLGQGSEPRKDRDTMTYQEAAEFIEQHDLRVVVLPDRSGFAIYRPTRLSVARAIANAATFESAVEDAERELARELETPSD
jgi:hypothetical protein